MANIFFHFYSFADKIIVKSIAVRKLKAASKAVKYSLEKLHNNNKHVSKCLSKGKRRFSMTNLSKKV